MTERVTIKIVNETEFPLIATGATLNFKLDRGSLEGGSPTPPCPIASKGFDQFTTSATGVVPGIAGWICYELADPKLVVQIMWSDPSGDNGFRLGLNALAGHTRDLELLPVTFADTAGASLSFDQAKAAASFTAIFTVRLKPDPTAPAAPVAPTGPVVAGPVLATTGGAGNQTLDPGAIYRWDDARMTPKRQKLLAVIARSFPMAFGGKDTDAPFKQGKYMEMVYWTAESKGTSCTAAMPNIKAWAGASGGSAGWAFDVAWLPHVKAWRPFTKDKMPSVGDIYSLYVDEPGAPFQRHVGFILQVPKSTSEWFVTADAGQNHPATRAQAAHFVPRPWELRVPVTDDKTHDFAAAVAGLAYPHLGGGAEGAAGAKGRLLGWMDLDDVSIKFKDTKFDDAKYDTSKYRIGKYTELDYKNCGARIKIVLDNKDK